ncbi:RNA polymerase II mediator complex family protein [Salix suchowensis]|nr:RNA polymerase II mediator complex family protein [Salix suchowensis]
MVRVTSANKADQDSCKAKLQVGQHIEKLLLYSLFEIRVLYKTHQQFEVVSVTATKQKHKDTKKSLSRQQNKRSLSAVLSSETQRRQRPVTNFNGSVVCDGFVQNTAWGLVEKTLGLLHQLYLTVSSFNTASQLPLLQRLNGLVTELDNMVKLSEKCNIQVPMEVLNLIDDGKNPDEFTKDVISSCIAKNQVTKGKTDAFKSLRKHLLEELEQTFPDEVESYREIRAMSSAEAKRLAQAQSSLPNGDVKVKAEH